MTDVEAVPMGHEEETIESSKYLPRRPRAFDEEPFVLPESYGVDHLRLLVKDPEWLFAYWDVDPRSLEALRARLGERALALAQVTLRVHDVQQGETSVILLPAAARSWYVRVDPRWRVYRGELGVTLPSGHFHRLAESPPVRLPPAGPSAEPAQRSATVAESRQAAFARDPPPDPARQGAAAPWSASHTGDSGASDVFRR